MPKILHEQRGLKIVKNDKNKFCVVTLHYTADPAKRTKEWKNEASAGMHPAKFAQEYEIDYTALYGEKVFPEITAGKLKIVVNIPYPEFPPTQVYWGGLDYGGRNPSSFHIYTIVDDVVYSIWELYEPCRNIPEFVQKMRECPYWDNIKYIAADPSIWYKNQQTKQGALTSIYSLFVENKVNKLMQGITDEPAWVAMMRHHWQNLDEPTFRIFDCCANQIREFEGAIYVSTSERLLQTQNYREAISDHNNHSLDDCKYFMNSRPRLARRDFKTPNVLKRWLN
jgi:hypothetical protein